MSEKNATDVTDKSNGEILKSVISSDESEFVLSLSLSTDGVAIFKSNNLSLWPVQVVQNFLPPEIRYFNKYVIVTNLYFGSNKPDMTKFIQPLVNEIDELNRNGFTVTYNYETIRFTVFITHCCVDLQAKTLVQQIKLYNAYNSCTYCKHPGNSIINVRNSRRYVRYICALKPYSYRTHNDLASKMSNNLNAVQNEEKHGIKGRSCMRGFENVDMVFGFGIDYMHAVLLGVMAMLLNLWCDSSSKKRSFYIKEPLRILLDSRILSIKPCSFIKRKPRSLKNKAKFKANELRSLLLYFLVTEM